MSILRIFLADDHAVVRAGLKTLIDSSPGMTVVGEASDGVELLAHAPLLAPDVIVMDISMPKLNGAQTTARLKEKWPKINILALSVHEDRSYLRELLEAGASGYALKRAAAVELIRAIEVVAGGGLYVDPTISNELVRSFVQPRSEPGTGGALSGRETKVLRMVAEGHSTKEIAASLDISVKTVETYKARAMEKLGLQSRVDIVRHAKNAGWFHA